MDEADDAPRAAARRRLGRVDEITELILEGKEVPEDLIRKALRKGTLEGKFTPVHCGSGEDVPRRAAPARPGRRLPAQPARPAAGRRHAPEDQGRGRPQAGREGAVQRRWRSRRSPRPTGDLVYIRVYSGELKPGETYLNTTNGKKERIARFYRMMGDKRHRAGEGRPGRHRRRRRPEGHVHGQHAVRPGRTRSRWKSIQLPEAGHRRRR